MSSFVTPEHTLSTVDPGDDTQSRFRYQALYAALKSLELIREGTNIDLLYCEHHEDVLLKCKDGKFIGIQVKTKSKLYPFKANDEPMLEALAHFVYLEKKFLGHFSLFVLAVNCGMWTEDKTSSNLLHLLELIRQKNTVEEAMADAQLKSFLKRLLNICSKDIKNKNSVEKNGAEKSSTKYKKHEKDVNGSKSENTTGQFQVILNTLKKIQIEDDLPKFADIETILSKELGQRSNNAHQPLESIHRAAVKLADKIQNASSANRDFEGRHYLILYEDREQQKVQAIIAAKRITKEDVTLTIQESLNARSYLRTQNYVPLTNLPKGLSILERKMAAGGIKTNNIFLAKDQKYSVEYLLEQWRYKYGTEEATRRYEHLCMVVGNQCQEAQDTVAQNAALYGQAMLNELRNRLQNIKEKRVTSTFDCEYEHLLGFAALLTEDCRVWWSDEFDLLKEA